jgi:hypothetical protein
MDYKQIMNIVPIVQSASLLNENVKYLNKKKKKRGDLLKLGVTNILGASIIKAESDFING